MPRKKLPTMDTKTARSVGGVLRGLRWTAGFKAVHQGAPQEIRFEATAAIVTALSLPAYHVTQAMDLMARLRAPAGAGRS